MTDLADGVVYSRSGLTYQAGLLEKAGLVETIRIAARSMPEGTLDDLDRQLAEQHKTAHREARRCRRRPAACRFHL